MTTTPKMHPRMLYIGYREKYTYKIAKNAAEENALRRSGYVDYVDLPLTSQKHDDAIEAGEVVPAEKYNDLLIKIEGLEEEVKYYKKITKESADQVTELFHQLRVKELEAMSLDELKAELTAKGIKFKSSDSKPDLINLILSDGASANESDN